MCGVLDGKKYNRPVTFHKPMYEASVNSMDGIRDLDNRKPTWTCKLVSRVVRYVKLTSKTN